MAAKLTDESVAKALGWKRVPGGWLPMTVCAAQWRTTVNFPWPEPPRLTTSLDIIVAEIEARGLQWRIIPSAEPSRGKFYAEVDITGSRGFTAKSGYAETAPLALCAALLAYLKEGKP